MSRLAALHRQRAEQILSEVESLAGTMGKVAAHIREVLDRGGTLQIQPQMAFAVGALMRIEKDWGVVEQLQSEGVGQRRTMR